MIRVPMSDSTFSNSYENNNIFNNVNRFGNQIQHQHQQQRDGSVGSVGSPPTGEFYATGSSYSSSPLKGPSQSDLIKRKTTGPIHNPKYKMKMCENYELEGSCPYNEKCQFAHGQAELDKWIEKRRRMEENNNNNNNNNIRRGSIGSNFGGNDNYSQPQRQNQHQGDFPRSPISPALKSEGPWAIRRENQTPTLSSTTGVIKPSNDIEDSIMRDLEKIVLSDDILELSEGSGHRESLLPKLGLVECAPRISNLTPPSNHSWDSNVENHHFSPIMLPSHAFLSPGPFALPAFALAPNPQQQQQQMQQSPWS